jgi:hypothetical protein
LSGRPQTNQAAPQFFGDLRFFGLTLKSTSTARSNYNGMWMGSSRSLFLCSADRFLLVDFLDIGCLLAII